MDQKNIRLPAEVREAFEIYAKRHGWTERALFMAALRAFHNLTARQKQNAMTDLDTWAEVFARAVHATPQRR